MFTLAVLLFLPAASVPSHALFFNSTDWTDGVVIVVYQSQYGTGWWVAQNYLVTAAHVVGWQVNATVTVVRGDWKTTGKAVYVNKKTDVAVITVPEMPVEAHVYPVASKVSQLQTLYVIGYPYELLQLSQGNIVKASVDPRVARGFAAWYNGDYHLIEFQAETDAGNSGGPVVYSNGAVAGLVSFALTGKAGTLYFATDADAIRQALDAVHVKYTSVPPPVAEDADVSFEKGLVTGLGIGLLPEIAMGLALALGVVVVWVKSRA